MTDLPYVVSRDITISANVATVWSYLSSDAGWAAWWGPGSTIAGRPGGAMTILYPNGQTAAGTVLEADPPRRIRFTWGFDRPDSPIPLEGSVVEITLTAASEGTRLQLAHSVPDEPARGQHEPGWRYQLGLLRSLISQQVLSVGLAARIDRWHAAWATADAGLRQRLLADTVAAAIVVDEPMAALVGGQDLDAWIEQSQRHFPAIVQRSSAPALCAEVATWDWLILAGDATVATGRSVALLAPDGCFRRVVSFWLSAPPGIPTSVVS